MITRDDVEYVARLSRLEMDDADLDKFVPHIQEILSYVEKLDELDTSDVEPTAHVLPMQNVSRADEVKPSISNDEALKSAPETADGFFLVPPVID